MKEKCTTRALQWLNSRNGNLISALVVFSVTALALNLLKSTLDFDLLRILSIFNYFVLIPLSLIVLLRFKKFAALLLLLLYIFPVPLRFITPMDKILQRDKETLYRASVQLEDFIYEYNELPYTWDRVIETGKMKKVPISWVDFAPMSLDNNYEKNVFIISSPFKMDGEYKFLYYDHNRRDFFRGIKGPSVE